jgi:hypothetical protein
MERDVDIEDDTCAEGQEAEGAGNVTAGDTGF